MALEMLRFRVELSAVMVLETLRARVQLPASMVLETLRSRVQLSEKLVESVKNPNTFRKWNVHIKIKFNDGNYFLTCNFSENVRHKADSLSYFSNNRAHYAFIKINRPVANH
jgi:hypothetical protein